MNFSKRLPPGIKIAISTSSTPITMMMMTPIIIIINSINPPVRIVSNNLKSPNNLLINDNLIRSVYFIIRNDAVLQDEPPRSPSLAVIDPLVENPADSVAD